MRSAFLAVLSVAVSATIAQAQVTRHVPGQYATIQAAVDAAGPNDTILVAPGVYRSFTYRKKTIAVKSSHGPERTTVDARGRGSAVTIDGTGATLAGFTVTGGSGVPGAFIKPCPSPCNMSFPVPAFLVFRGAGILATASGVVIRDNIIRDNKMVAPPNQLVGYGAGIWAASGALIQGNRITNNFAGADSISVLCSWCGIGSLFSIGGGVYASGSAFVSDNVITANTASTGAGIAIQDGTFVNNIVASNIGPGVMTLPPQAPNTLEIINATIVRNQGTGVHLGWLMTGIGTRYAITNSIVRNNGVRELASASSVTFSNVKGGFTGVGNFDAPALMVDDLRGDYHLRYDSPCRDAGKTTASLPAMDFEGNARVLGGKVDVGADEFGDRVYVTGDSRPGGLIHVKIVGKPGQAAYWAYSLTSTLQDPPIPTTAGPLYLRLPIFVLSAGTIPAIGVKVVPIPLPAALPRGIAIPIQALVGSRLTNPWIQVIR